MAQPHAEFLLDSAVRQPTRFRHERQQHRRYHFFQFGSWQARRALQVARVGNHIEVFRHLHLRIVDCVIDATGLPPIQGHNDNARQVVGMDMIRVDIIFRSQCRRAFLQTLDRQPVVRIDSRHAKNRQSRTRPASPSTQCILCIYSAQSASILWPDRARLIDQFSSAIAVDARRADIGQGGPVG